ncbi:MAG: glucosamine--fructose-6-phosphate aminotransferase (isomerizing) [Candidatus Paceibacteria bacterium]|jgi:glucosamine--fructose-6-phosphate aminotransferase (isomerizing)
MCGIFGYVGQKQVAPILLAGLRQLEYRGYDSAGIYVVGQKPIKAVGPIVNLTAKVPTDLVGTTGIAHTRWATHGAPTVANAHPHTGAGGSIAIVHNGIIENFRELKEGLVAQGITFESETDTEVLAKLIGSLYKGNLQQAVQAALARVRGTYGLMAASEDNPDQIVVARMGSPVVLGLSDEGNFAASDPSALLMYTKDVVYLEDGDMAVVTEDSYRITTIKGAAVERAAETVDWDVESIQKQGYEHFMLKEIHEAAEVIKNTTRGRIIVKEGKVKLGGLEVVLDQIKQLDRLVIVGCGSAYYGAQVGRYMLEEYAGIPVEVELGSEYRYKNNLQTGRTAVLAITQSGETADTLASIRKAKAAGLLTLGIVNTVGSTIARETDAGVHNHAGPEIAVASTKACLSQLTVLVLLTVLIGRENGKLSESEAKKILSGLQELPAVIEQYLSDTSDVQAVAKKYAHYTNAMFIGRKLHAPLAFEGSLKLKECTYVHAEAYAGGELKHGSIALLDENFPVIAIAPQDDVYEKMVSNIEEVKARSAPTLVLATKGDEAIKHVADDVLYIPSVHPILQPIITSIPLQLLAYYVGTEKGLNVDRPRNLAKSVTVE